MESTLISEPRTPVATPGNASHRSEDVVGLRFDILTLPQAIEKIDGFVAGDRCRQVVMANAYTVSVCRRHPPVHPLFNSADLILPDGMSIVWGARWLGVRIPQRVAGPDLTAALCQRAAEKAYKIFLMGSSWENLEQLRSIMTSRWPGLRISGVYSPPITERFDEAETTKILQQLEIAQPDILLVGVSAPKQEIWIAENKHRLPVRVAIGVGAAFDFISGRVPRAPDLLQRNGLEWLYRLAREPRRLWKRYLLGNAVFLSLLGREALRRRFSRA